MRLVGEVRRKVRGKEAAFESGIWLYVAAALYEDCF